MASALVELSSSRCFNGFVTRYEHVSSSLGGIKARFSVFVPPDFSDSGEDREEPYPALFYLAGIECDDTTCFAKSGIQRSAASRGLAVVAPDTSPRGCNIEGEADCWDFGLGAGFYVDATAEKWSRNYRMAEYVAQELPALVRDSLPELNANLLGITGHSMGGHGAITLGLRFPEVFSSVSALAPICSLPNSPWGAKALSHLLGPGEGLAERAKTLYDASEVLKAYRGPHRRVLVDQGSADRFVDTQLKPELLQASERPRRRPESEGALGWDGCRACSSRCRRNRI